FPLTPTYPPARPAFVAQVSASRDPRAVCSAITQPLARTRPEAADAPSSKGMVSQLGQRV
ncbi:MAG TPA: hypothetical protein VMX14_05825, partial [Anaerolineae bacterium]|nr:hypothetical protein [Anaerolineae bacterium]